MSKKIYLSSPHMTGEEQKYIDEAFASNWVAPLGPNVEAFEEELAKKVGSIGALALGSGTAAIHLALKLLGVTKGDTVFCSSLTFAASAFPIVYQGAEPGFIDSDEETWNMSPEALEKALHNSKKKGKLPKAIIVVDLYGQSADMDNILDLGHCFGVPIIEDAAEALGSTYKGKSCGTIGALGVYSFNGNKIITTSGGGALVSQDPEMIKKARFWATQSREAARHYQHNEIGYNYRMSNILAGIGRAQLGYLEERVSARRKVFNRYYCELAGIEGIHFMPEASYGTTNRWLTTLTINPELCGITANEIIDVLAENNIEARPVWKPMHLQPVFADCPYFPKNETQSISDQLFANGICLPSGSNMTIHEQTRVIDLALSCLKSSQ